jgi:hypothetical protein
MCLVLAYSFQKLAKVLGRTAVNGDGQQPDEDEDEEIFDIDPLLIPLLYHQDQEELDANSSSSSAFVAGGPRTLAEVFRASTRKALGYVDRHLQGGGVDTLEVTAVRVPFFFLFFFFLWGERIGKLVSVPLACHDVNRCMAAK